MEARVPRAPARRRAPVGVLGLSILICLIAACAPSAHDASASATSSPTTITVGPAAAVVPSEWNVLHPDFVTSLSTFHAYAGTVELHDPCLRTGNMVECGSDRAYQLVPHSVAVSFSTFYNPAMEPLDGPLHVGEMPAAFEESGDASRQDLTWRIAIPAQVDAQLIVTASIRGPDASDLREDVERMIASLRFVPPPTHLPTGLEGRAAAEAVLPRIRELVLAMEPAMSCMPDHPGELEAASVDTLPMGGQLDGPVTCGAEIVPTAIGMWKATFTWTSASGGRYVFTQWAMPDGTLSAASGATNP